jgi:hypothetical protein
VESAAHIRGKRSVNHFALKDAKHVETPPLLSLALGGHDSSHRLTQEPSGISAVEASF